MDDIFPALHWTNFLIIPGLLVGYTVHELGHALTAYFLGDYSQVERGRITLNPLKHISWFGSFSFILFGVGWPKPIQANFHSFKRGYLDLFLVALSGPLASLTFGLVGLLLTLALASAVVYVGGVTTDQVLLFLQIPTTGNLPESLNVQAWSMAFTKYIFTTSFWLAFISLLPLPGLDGFAALASMAQFLRERRKKIASPRPQPVLADTPLTLSVQQKRRNSAAEIHFNAGAEYHAEKKHQDAIARYRQAIRSDENFGPAYVNLGLAYLALGRRRDGIQAFRGALQYADEKKSQAEAWQQLHQLSAVTPIDENAAQVSMAEMGAEPWTDTKPRPNWLMLGIGAGLFLIGGIFLYSYLLTEMLQIL